MHTSSPPNVAYHPSSPLLSPPPRPPPPTMNSPTQEVEERPPAFRPEDLFSAFLLGVATLCLFMGYFAHSFISEAVLHAKNQRDPDMIDEFAGYYGQAVQFGVFAVSCLFSPSLVRLLSSKGSLLLCALLFMGFFIGFVHLNSYYYYISQSFVGLGYALFNNAEGAYLAEHSSPTSLEWNMALETGIGHGGQLVAGLSLYLVATMESTQEDTVRVDYPDDHIIYLYTLFFVVAFVAFLFYLCLPTRQFDDCIAKRDVSSKLGFIDQTVSTLRCGLSPRMLLLIPASLYQGAFTAFFLAVYPTSFSFDTRLKEDVYLVAYYCASIGVGVVLAGVVISQLSKRIRNFSMMPTMLIHFVLMLLLLAIMVSSTSDLAFISETSEPSWLFQPNRWSVCSIAMLVGICDCCVTTARGVLCQRIVPGKRMEAFSMTKLVQALSGCMVFNVSPHLTVSQWVVIFYALLSLGIVSFIAVATNILRSESAPSTPQKAILPPKSTNMEHPV